MLSGTYQCFYEISDMEKGDFGDSESWKILQIVEDLNKKYEIFSVEKYLNDETNVY